MLFGQVVDDVISLEFWLQLDLSSFWFRFKFFKLTGELLTRAGLTYLYGLYLAFSFRVGLLESVFLSRIDKSPSDMPTIKLLSPFLQDKIMHEKNYEYKG